MDDLVAEIVRTAVSVAREEWITQVSTLRQRLAEMFPGRPDEIEAALALWAKNANA